MSTKERPDGRVSRLRILLVEDEIMLALTMEDLLADLGHEVVATVARLSTAMQIAQEEELDMAILDVNIRGETSYAVADALDARGVPFVFVTGYEAERLREPYCNGAVLQKPFLSHELEKAISAAYRANGRLPAVPALQAELS